MNISITYVLSNSWFMFDEKPLEIFRSASAPHDVMEFLLWPSTTLHHQPIWLCAILPTLIRCGVGLYGLRGRRGLFSEQFYVKRMKKENSLFLCYIYPIPYYIYYNKFFSSSMHFGFFWNNLNCDNT